MRRLLRAGLFALSATVLACVFLLALLLYSPEFNRWLVFKFSAMVPELSIAKVDGLLLGEMHLQGLKYRVEQADISIESVSYRLSLAELLSRQVQVEYLHVNGVDVLLLESAQPAEKESEADIFIMPVTLRVDDFTLSELQVKQNDTLYPIKKISLALVYQGQQIQLSQFSLTSARGQLQGKAELQLESRLPFKVDFTVEKAIPDVADIKARLSLHGDSQEIYLNAELQTPGELQIHGKINLNGKSPRFDLSGSWAHLQWPLQSDKQYASDNARLTLQGTLNDYFISLDSDIFIKDLSTGKLHLKGQGDIKQFTLNDLTLKALAGEIQSKGRISWSDNAPSQLQVLANNIQLAPFLAGYSSELNLDALISGRLFNNPDFYVEVNKLQGRVIDKPVSAKARMHYSPKQLFIDQLLANVGDNSLIVQGVVGDHSSVKFTLDAANLHELSPDLYGSIFAQGSLQGSVDNPVVQFKLESGGLKFRQQQLGSLHVKGRLTATGEGQLDLAVKARQLVFNSMTIDKLELQSIGQFALHDLRAIVKSEQGDMELAIQGIWSPATKDWQGYIQQLKIQNASAGSWQLIKAAPLQIKLATQETVQLQTDLCLAQRGETGLLCLQASTDQHRGQILEGEIKQLPLSVFKDWLPDIVQIDSHLEAIFSLQSQSGLLGEVDMSLAPGSISIDYEQAGLQILAFKEAQLDAQLLPDKLQSNVSFVLNDGNHIEGRVKVTGLEKKETASIDGLVNIQLENISFLDAFVDSVSGLAGEVNAQLVLQGLLSAPQLKGSKASVVQGKLFVPELGLQVNDINIELSHADQQQLSLQGKAKIAEQQIEINGVVDQYINDQFQFKMVIKGDSLQLMQTPETQVWISPDLRLEGDKSGAKLEGEVNIPQAILIFESLPEGSVALSDDEVIIADKKIAPKAPVYPLDVDIQIQLGKSVSLEGFGLKTHLQGQLRAVRKENQLKLYNELNSVKGTYKAYGQDLTIEKGQLLFGGEMENPGINILASRKASDWEDKTVAYLRMTGTLKNPVTTVYTEPALSESDSLAYLLTGAPLGKSDSSNAALLASAAMGLGRDYIDALMGVVGIDEFDMKSTSLGQNSMVIGKRISPDLYARYIMDVLTSEMQFAVIYKLTKNISIETRAGTTHSSDIKYNIEFD